MIAFEFERAEIREETPHPFIVRCGSDRSRPHAFRFTLDAFPQRSRYGWPAMRGVRPETFRVEHIHQHLTGNDLSSFIFDHEHT